MTNYTVSAAGPDSFDAPCPLDRVGADLRVEGRCGQPVRFAVDESDAHGPLIQFGACADHADLYR